MCTYHYQVLHFTTSSSGDEHSKVNESASNVGVYVQMPLAANIKRTYVYIEERSHYRGSGRRLVSSTRDTRKDGIVFLGRSVHNSSDSTTNVRSGNGRGVTNVGNGGTGMLLLLVVAAAGALRATALEDRRWRNARVDSSMGATSGVGVTSRHHLFLLLLLLLELLELKAAAVVIVIVDPA